MKAEYIDFNDSWHKDCTKCKSAYGSENGLDGLKQFFTNDKRKADGLDCVCRNCRSEYRKKNRAKETARWNKNVAPKTPARRKHVVRGMTRKKHGKANKYLCHFCDSVAQEWHHIIYERDTIVPLCKPCHAGISSARDCS